MLSWHENARVPGAGRRRGASKLTLESFLFNNVARVEKQPGKETGNAASGCASCFISLCGNVGGAVETEDAHFESGGCCVKCCGVSMQLPAVQHAPRQLLRPVPRTPGLLIACVEARCSQPIAPCHLPHPSCLPRWIERSGAIGCNAELPVHKPNGSGPPLPKVSKGGRPGAGPGKQRSPKGS